MMLLCNSNYRIAIVQLRPAPRITRGQHMSDQTVQRIVIDGLVFHGDGNPEPLHTGRVTAANITVAPYTQGFEPAFDAMSRRPEERRVGQECVSPCRSRGALSNETKTGQKIY